MFTFVKKVYEYFSYETAKSEYEKQLDIELSKLEQDEDDRRKEEPEPVVEEILENKNCFRKIGFITALEGEYGMIDKTQMFDMGITKGQHFNLRIGVKVRYLAYKPPNSECAKIVKIDQVIDDAWDREPQQNAEEDIILDDQESELKYFNIHQRTVIGLIVHRNENFITVDTDYDKLDVDLDNVCLEFVPQLGDRLLLICNVQTDKSFVDTAGEILEVINIYPAREKKFKADITEVHSNWGVINRDCFFAFDVLETGYSNPSVGDKVFVEVVENEREKFQWRCLKVCSIEKVTSSIIIANAPDPRSIDLVRNKHGITITQKIKFFMKNIDESAEQEFVVTNGSDRIHKILRSYFMGKKSESQLKLLKPQLNDTFFINAGESVTFYMGAKAKLFGQSREMFVISFGGGFKIGREIEVNVGDVDNDGEQTKFVNKFQRNAIYANQVWSRKYDRIPGVPVNVRPKFVANKIGLFEVPERIRKVVLTAPNQTEMGDNVEELAPFIRKPVSFEIYVDKFQLLLYLEEIEFFISMRKYDCERAHFIRDGEFLVLKIENLAERRPSLMIGDSIRATNPWAEEENIENRCFEGIIHKVLCDRVLLKFNPSFHSKYNGEDYRLEFSFSRFGFRKQHYAIRKVVNHLGVDFLFPVRIKVQENLQLGVSLNEDFDLVVKDTSKNVKWFNAALNPVQKEAVKNILRGEARPLPYVIFGPPGTGKTITLIETILQLVQLVPNSRLLVATPSNSAADLIATRLIDSNSLLPGDFVRLVSQNLVEKDLIPDHLKPYCATLNIAREGTAKDEMIVTESGLKLKCQTKHLGKNRITIGTCITLGTLLQMDFPRGHFTHVLIDESGQSQETEVMIPITQVDRFTGQIILAGDPMQLGPIVLSKFAGDCGLETSFLSRLLDHVPYKKDKERFPPSGFDPRLVTKLVYNYRALPTILNVYNDLFYDSELKPMIDDDDSREVKLLRSLNGVVPSDESRAPEHAVFFVGVRGENKQDLDSPSWYNAAEAQHIFMFTIKLYNKQVPSKSIGIIAPYQKQVRAIRNIFAEANLMVPKVGSVEEFQGQERDIILISTVRSRKALIEVDLKHALGFVQSKKRMNVAISRAKTLLVVFGNPHLLGMDPCWRHLIKYCVSKNAYLGCDLPSQFLL